jgi:hypothetical protein
MIEIGQDLLFIPQRGLYLHTPNGEQCIAASDGYITPLFVMALQGKLSERDALLQSREWELLPVNTTFISYRQLCHYLALMQNDFVRQTIPQGQYPALDTLTRAYLNSVIQREDAIVLDKPSVWFEPAFYPAGIYSESQDFDPYSRYDAIPFGGFARVAFYFFIANTAKTAIKNALLPGDLFTAAKAAIDTCKAIFDDRKNIHLQHGMFRKLLEHYLDWCYEQTDLRLGNNVALSEEDLWQEIYQQESHSYTLFHDHLNKLHLSDLRPLLNLQGDLLKRMQKDHPTIRPTEKEQNSLESTFAFTYRKEKAYSLLIDFLMKEKDKTGRTADADWARHALVLFEHKSKILVNCPNTFTEWLHQFCELFGRPWVRDYEPNKLRTRKKSMIEKYIL